MSSLFEPSIAGQIISRIQALQPGSKAQWGKMSVAQMLAHCQKPFKAFFGDEKIKRGLIGILFGKIAKKKLFSDEPWSHNLPTSPEFKIKTPKDFTKEKQALLELIERFTRDGKNISQNNHPFFGTMTNEEWGILNYRHLDHHLMQFGA